MGDREAAPCVTGDDVDDDDNDKEISINVLEFHFGTVHIISIMHLRVC